jgi:hypothetical protein
MSKDISRLRDGLGLPLMIIAAALAGSTGCRAVTGVFRAGLWTGIVGFVLVFALVFGVVRMLGHRRA